MCKITGMKSKPDKSETSTASGTFSWNLVKGAGLELGNGVSDEVRSRIERLGRLLDRFPPEQVHLLVSLGELEGNGFETKLDLKLPATVLHAKDKGTDLFETVRHSFFVLERQLETLLAELRGEHRWKRRKVPGMPVGETPSPSEPVIKEPQSQRALLRNFILHHYNRLLLHASRRVSGFEADADIPQGSIDAQEVLDEVTRICLEFPDRKPLELTYELWLFRLISEEMDREYRDWLSINRGRLDSFGPEAGAREELSMQDATVLDLEPDESLDEEQFIDPNSPSPDLLLEESDLVAEVMRRVRYWKRRDREIFTLHFLDGFDAVETAMVEKMEVPDVEKVIETLHVRLRKILHEAGK